jgi:hypothetical protein
MVTGKREATITIDEELARALEQAGEHIVAV